MNRIAIVLCLALITPLLPHSHPALAPRPNARPSGFTVCNPDRTLCVKPALVHSLVQNPLYFEVQIRSADPIELGWELRDGSGKFLDKDPDGRLAFLLHKSSGSRRILAVRDFALAPALSGRGALVLHATTIPNSGKSSVLPELAIPLRLDRRTTKVTFAIPAGQAFDNAVTNTVEADPAHPIPMQAEVHWRSATLLYVKPAMRGGAAAESAARDTPGQGPWHVINYRKVQDTAHLALIGDGWAGVTYYLTGLDYLLERTEKHQPGVRHVVSDPQPDFGQ